MLCVTAEVMVSTCQNRSTEPCWVANGIVKRQSKLTLVFMKDESSVKPSFWYVKVIPRMCGYRGGVHGSDPPPPWKITKYSNTDPNPLKNHKAAKPAFHNGPSLARMAFRWRADDGPKKVLFGSTHQLKKTLSKLDHLWKKHSGSAHAMGCPPVRGDNPRALASGLSYVQVGNMV